MINLYIHVEAKIELLFNGKLILMYYQIQMYKPHHIAKLIIKHKTFLT